MVLIHPGHITQWVEVKGISDRMSEIRLLLLHGDEASGVTMRETAVSIGVQARHAADSPEFFALIEKWEPTHMVLDFETPGIDASAVITELAIRNCSTAVILSRSSSPDALEVNYKLALMAGLTIVGILPKPYGPSTLTSLLLPSLESCLMGSTISKAARLDESDSTT